MFSSMSIQLSHLVQFNILSNQNIMLFHFISVDMAACMIFSTEAQRRLVTDERLDSGPMAYSNAL